MGTVNDDLEKSEGEWRGKRYSVVGGAGGYILSDKNDVGRRIACKADITYGTDGENGCG